MPVNALHRCALAASSMGRVGMHGDDVSFGMFARGCGAFLSERNVHTCIAIGEKLLGETNRKNATTSSVPSVSISDIFLIKSSTITM